MPNGRSPWSALQREPPPYDHTSDEECEREAKKAWPRPHILALWTMRAWQTFINRSYIATSSGARLVPLGGTLPNRLNRLSTVL